MEGGDHPCAKRSRNFHLCDVIADVEKLQSYSSDLKRRPHLLTLPLVEPRLVGRASSHSLRSFLLARSTDPALASLILQRHDRGDPRVWIIEQ
jgi:hypothetical protein